MEIDPKYNLVEASTIHKHWKQYLLEDAKQYNTFNDYLYAKLGY